MKARLILVTTALFFIISGCKFLHIDGFTGSTLLWESGANNYFNQEKANELKTPKEILITGEVEKDVIISLKNIPWHSVAVREGRMGGDTLNFEGAFRYDGYALCDILSSVKIDKKSKKDFYPPVDLYVEVYNKDGEFATFSWGEIFYSANMYQIIIAKNVTRVIPGKTGELWPLPKTSKIVAGTDRLTVRNISDPVKIVIKSLKGNFIVNRKPEKFYADLLELKGPDSLYAKLQKLPENLPVLSCESIYYGHGMGYKGYKTFSGVSLGEVMKPYYPDGEKFLREGLVCIEGVDGYRASFSLSELINRNDQQDPLLMFGSGKDKGYETFSLYASCDMFADRSVKGVNKITLY
ncbi:MAG: hypothetical protein WCX48_04120 [Bacteroidales bacterium]